jgi:hypothetical protein
VRLSSWEDSSLEDAEVSEKPPKKDEDEDRRETSTAQFLGSVSSSETT